MSRKLNSFSPLLALPLMCALFAFTPACNRAPSQPPATKAQAATRRYPFKGKVISIDQQAVTANIGNEPIAGFMNSMAMSYTIQPAATLNQLQPGDSITADVVVQADNKYWLENVKVTGHSPVPQSPP